MSLAKRIILSTALLCLILYLAFKYSVSYYVLTKLREQLDTNHHAQLSLKNIDFAPLGLILKIKNVQLANNAKLGSIRLNVSLRDFSGNVSGNYTVEAFDLQLIQYLVSKPDMDWHNLSGRLSANGNFAVTENAVKLNAVTLTLDDFKSYNSEQDLFNYYIKNLTATEIEIINKSELSSLKTETITINNLLLSTSSDNLTKDKPSEFSEIRISNIDLSYKHKLSETKAIIKFINGGFFEFNSSSLDDKNSITAIAEAIDLRQFSNSFESLINYHITSGFLSMDSKVVIDDTFIKGKVMLNFKHLNLDDQDEHGAKLDTSSSLPLKTAITLLKDDKNNLNFEFDIKGNKTDPRFNVFNMIGKGAGSLLVTQLSTLIATEMAEKFLPLLVSSLPASPGSIFTFTNGAYKWVTKPRFKNITFIPLHNDITEESQIYLTEVIEFLSKNDQLSVHICPIATKAEFNNKKYSNAEVLELAKLRINELERFFKKSSHNNILAQTIFCRPQLSDSTKIAIAEIAF